MRKCCIYTIPTIIGGSVGRVVDVFYIQTHKVYLYASGVEMMESELKLSLYSYIPGTYVYIYTRVNGCIYGFIHVSL